MTPTSLDLLAQLQAVVAREYEGLSTPTLSALSHGLRSLLQAIEGERDLRQHRDAQDEAARLYRQRGGR